MNRRNRCNTHPLPTLFHSPKWLRGLDRRLIVPMICVSEGVDATASAVRLFDASI